MTPTARARALPAGIALAALPVFYVVNPNTTHVPLCPLHALTGLWCPLCGATRAGYALVHGDLTTALRDNGLVLLALPLLLLWWWNLTSPGPARRIPRPVFWTLLAVTAIFTLARNLAIGSLLAPAA